eukprot:TRINITY_DN4501_c0_g1_i1.p1 TRINITY_DN4501_c0_g1~~TRINITY_DN4501_c0_g1_i1.p1  ORF type:complete len:103 (-),score=0.18 TRINITY_DN4501_c0_g1_i1:164-472(-)
MNKVFRRLFCTREKSQVHCHFLCFTIYPQIPQPSWSISESYKHQTTNTSLSTNDISKLAKLSALALSERQTEQLQKDVVNILSFMEMIQKVGMRGSSIVSHD